MVGIELNSWCVCVCAVCVGGGGGGGGGGVRRASARSQPSPSASASIVVKTYISSVRVAVFQFVYESLQATNISQGKSITKQR